MIRLIAAVRATLTAVTLLAGPPILLVALGGNPLPDRAPSATQIQTWLDHPLQAQYMPATARVVAWLFWALLAAVILAVWVLRARRWRWASLTTYLPRPVQGLAATLLGAATVTTTAAGALPAHAADPATVSGPGPPGAATTAAPVLAAVSDHQVPHDPAAAPRTITVHRGDTLWDIAAAELGDPHNWAQIYRLNTGRYPHMRAGRHIEPGWTLALPPSTTAPANRPQPDTGPARPGTLTPVSPAPGPTGPRAPGTADPSAAARCTAAPAAGADGPASPPGSHESPAGSTPHQGPDRGHRHGPVAGLSLPSGSWVDLGLATAIASAAILVWAHRRRRYTRRPLSPDLRLNDPGAEPMPPVVNQIRRLHRGMPAPEEQQGGTDAALELVTGTPPTRDEGMPGPADADPGERHSRNPDGRAETQDGQDETADEHVAAMPSRSPRPVVPSLAHPLATAWPPAGLGLTGPGAHAAARGLLTAALAAGGHDTPDERSWVVIPSSVAATLLGAGTGTWPHTPRLSVTAGVDEALELLEAQALHRSRIVYAHEVDTVTELRTADPTGEPLPAMMLLADAATSHQRTRLAALLAQGQRLDIHGVLLGTWPEGDTIEVAADGTTTIADCDGDGPRRAAHPADIGRLAVLTRAETSDLLRILAESHTGQRQPTAPNDQTATATRDSHTAERAVTTTREHDGQSATAPTPPASPAPRSARGAATDEDPLIDDAGRRLKEPANDTDTDSVETETSATGQAKVTVLGPARILGLPAGITPRKKSVELLVYLAVHDGEASAEAILDDVLGDAPTSKAPGRLYTYVSDLRTVLRRTAGPGTYISHPGHRYVLNRDLVDIDLWRMQAAIRDAALATLGTDPAERQNALRQAVDTYSGLLADGADYEWIEPYREAVRQQALDAYLALADTLADAPAEQITVLDAAIRHNPYTEQLYQQAMTTRATLGHLDAIRTLRRALTHALDEIDAEPADETIALADQLVAQLQRASRPELRRAPRPGQGAAA